MFKKGDKIVAVKLRRFTSGVTVGRTYEVLSVAKHHVYLRCDHNHDVGHSNYTASQFELAPIKIIPRPVIKETIVYNGEIKHA